MGQAKQSTNRTDLGKPIHAGQRGGKNGFERYGFAASVALLLCSVLTLATATVIAKERTVIPFTGVSIDKPITSGLSTVEVTNVSLKPGIKQFTAPASYEYLVLILNVRNNSEKPFYIAPTLDTYIKSTTGDVIYLTPYELANPFHTGLVLPGESTKGELSFLVPKQADYKFYIESGWSGGVIPFDINPVNKRKLEG